MAKRTLGMVEAAIDKFSTVRPGSQLNRKMNSLHELALLHIARRQVGLSVFDEAWRRDRGFSTTAPMTSSGCRSMWSGSTMSADSLACIAVPLASRKRFSRDWLRVEARSLISKAGDGLRYSAPVGGPGVSVLRAKTCACGRSPAVRRRSRILFRWAWAPLG